MATELDIRKDVIAACQELNALGINQGTSGNVSARYKDTLLISPSARPYDLMQPDEVAALDLSGDMPTKWDGPLMPSTEWRFHWLLMKNRDDATAVVHAHPPYCTALAMLRKPIPACHYMIAVFGGMDVRVADYATYGSMELAEHVMIAMEGRSACLMANHGMLATGGGLQQAIWRAGELEALARQYHLCLQVGEPHILNKAQMDDTFSKLEGYGVQAAELAAE